MTGLPGTIAVGDPARPVIGRAMFRTLLAAGAFVVFGYGLKEIKPLDVHTPWMNDPYDTFVSFTIFFVPLVAGLSAARIALCRTSQPLPVQRVLDLLRGSRLVVGTVAITLLADWASVALRANRARWDAASGLEIGLLAVTSVVTARAALALRRASARVPVTGGPTASARVPVTGGPTASARAPVTGGPTASARGGPAQAPPDWLGDILLAASVHSRLLGPWHGRADRAARWAGRRLATPIRRHPLAVAAALSAGFGLALAGVQAFGEGIPPRPVSALYFIVSAGAMYAFIVSGGAYLGLVRSERPSRGTRRRLADAGAAACAALPIAIAFRYALWALAGSPAENLRHLWSLLLVSAAVAAISVFTAESLAGIHRSPGKRGR
jgi:hypothetical protein